MPNHIAEWRVRETTLTEGTADLVLAGAMYGSMPFQHTEVMAVGDTCDYVVHYGTVFEAGLGTMAADGKLQRGTIYRARHANGDINTTKVSLPPGVKTVIMSVRANKVVRTDIVQPFSQAERNQANANLGNFPSGTRMVFHQTAAPTGWTKDTTAALNDSALRIVTGTPSSGGSIAFSTLFGRTSTDSFALALTNLPNVNIIPSISGVGGVAQGVSTNTAVPPANVNTSAPLTLATYTAGSFGQITITLAGGNTPHSHLIDMRVKYQDVIIGIKD